MGLKSGCVVKDHRVKEKQSFKRLSVYISIKYRKLQSIKKLFIPFNFFAQADFLIDFSINFICVDAISIPISIQFRRGTRIYFEAENIALF